MRVSLSLLLGAFALSAPSALADDNKNHPLAKACIGKIQEETCPHAHRFRHALHRCTTRDDFDNTNMEHVAGCIKQYSGCEFLTGPGAVCCYASSQVPSFAHNDVLQHLCPMCANPKLSEKKTDKKMTLASKFGRGKHTHQEDAEELSLTLETAGVKCETGHHGCTMVGDACLTGDGRTRGVCVDAGLTKGGQRACTCDEVVSFEISEEIEDETPSLSVSLGDGTSTIKEELLDALIKIISELTNLAIEIVKENLNGPNVSVSYPHAEAPWVTSVDSKAKLWAGQVLSAYYHPTKRHSATTVGHLGAKKSEAAAGVWAVSIQTKAISGNKAFYNTLDD